MFLWLSISQDGECFIFSPQNNLLEFTIAKFSFTSTGRDFDSMYSESFSFVSTGKCNSMVELSVSTKCRLQTADCRLQTEYKVQTRYKMQTADCRLGIKCRLRPKLGINCRLSERNVFNVPQCHAISFPSLSAAKSFLLGAKRQH